MQSEEVFKLTGLGAFDTEERNTISWQTLLCFYLSKSLSQQFTFCLVVCLGLSA